MYLKVHGVGAAPPKWKCTKCSKEFISRYKIKRHLVDVHQEADRFNLGEGHKCEHCEKVYSENRHLLDHVR